MNQPQSRLNPPAHESLAVGEKWAGWLGTAAQPGAIEQDPEAELADLASNGHRTLANTLVCDLNEGPEPRNNLARAASPQSSQS